MYDRALATIPDRRLPADLALVLLECLVDEAETPLEYETVGAVLQLFQEVNDVE